MQLVKRILNSLNNRPRVSAGFFSSNMTIYVNNQIVSVARKGLNAIVVTADGERDATSKVTLTNAPTSNNEGNVDTKTIESLSSCQARRLVKKIYRANQPLHVRVLKFSAWITLFVIILNSAPPVTTAVTEADQQASAINEQLTQPLGLPAGPFTE